MLALISSSVTPSVRQGRSELRRTPTRAKASSSSLPQSTPSNPEDPPVNNVSHTGQNVVRVLDGYLSQNYVILFVVAVITNGLLAIHPAVHGVFFGADTTPNAFHKASTTRHESSSTASRQSQGVCLPITEATNKTKTKNFPSFKKHQNVYFCSVKQCCVVTKIYRPLNLFYRHPQRYTTGSTNLPRPQPPAFSSLSARALLLYISWPRNPTARHENANRAVLITSRARRRHRHAVPTRTVIGQSGEPQGTATYQAAVARRNTQKKSTKEGQVERAESLSTRANLERYL